MLISKHISEFSIIYNLRVFAFFDKENQFTHLYL